MAHPMAVGDWEDYPLCLSQAQHVGVDLQDQHDKLVEATPRIFSGQGDIEVWSRRDNQGWEIINICVPWLIQAAEIITQSIFDPVNFIRGCDIYTFQRLLI